LKKRFVFNEYTGIFLYVKKQDLESFLEGDRVEKRLTKVKKRNQSQNRAYLGVFRADER